MLGGARARRPPSGTRCRAKSAAARRPCPPRASARSSRAPSVATAAASRIVICGSSSPVSQSMRRIGIDHLAVLAVHLALDRRVEPALGRAAIDDLLRELVRGFANVKTRVARRRSSRLVELEDRPPSRPTARDVVDAVGARLDAAGTRSPASCPASPSGPMPSIMPPRSGIHCSRNSRWLTVPRQQPSSHASGASVSLSAASTPSAVAARGCRRRCGGCRRRGAAACAARERSARAAAAASVARHSEVAIDVGHGESGSLKPRERQVEQQVLRLQLAAGCRRPSPSRDRPAGPRSPAACRRDRRTRAGTGTAAAPSAPRRRRRDCTGRSAARSPRRRGPRATPSARRRSRAAGAIVTRDAEEMRDPALAARGQRRRAPAGRGSG